MTNVATDLIAVMYVDRRGLSMLFRVQLYSTYCRPHVRSVEAGGLTWITHCVTALVELWYMYMLCTVVVHAPIAAVIAVEGLEDVIPFCCITIS
jgi:hypothetical protein